MLVVCKDMLQDLRRQVVQSRCGVFFHVVAAVEQQVRGAEFLEFIDLRLMGLGDLIVVVFVPGAAVLETNYKYILQNHYLFLVLCLNSTILNIIAIKVLNLHYIQ